MLPPVIRAGWVIFAVAVILVAPAARADLRFDVVRVDLGDIRSNVPIVKAFSFANQGPEAVDLVEARPSCGCLKPLLAKMHFGPGERGDITLEVNTLGQPAGPHAWQVTLVYKVGGEVREQSLQVAGTVVTEVSVQPAAVTLVVEGPLTHEITLTDLRPRPLAITRLETTSAWLTADAGPLVRDAFNNATSKIRLAVGPSCPPGRHDEYIVIHTDDATYRELKVAVTVVKREHNSCVATPSEVMLSAGPRLVRLADRQGRVVVVESVHSDDPAITCRWASGPENQATLKMELDRSHWNGEGLETQVRVQTSSPVREVVTVRVRVAN
jgi:hypothetical protein